MFRTKAERKHPGLKRSINIVMKSIVDINKRYCPPALSVGSDMEMWLLNIVEHLRMLTTAITRDCYSAWHKNPNDVCEGGLMSAVVWFPEGMYMALTIWASIFSALVAA